MRRLTRGALAQMRTLLLELRSDSPADVPIDQLLRNAVEATEGRASIAIDLTLRGEGQPPRELHTAIYRVTQEALNNVVRHAEATHVTVELVTEPARVRLLVHDDGCGFEPGPLPATHVGLRSMRERAAEVGARAAPRLRPRRGYPCHAGLAQSRRGGSLTLASGRTGRALFPLPPGRHLPHVNRPTPLAGRGGGGKPDSVHPARPQERRTR